MAKRKATMTDRERVEALLRNEKPDRVPIWPYSPAGFSALHTGISIVEAYNQPEKTLAAQRKTAYDFGWIFVPMIGYAAMGGWEFGGDIKWPSEEFSQAPTVMRHPAQTIADAMNLKVPDVKNSGIVPIQVEFYKMAAQEQLDNEPFNVRFPGSVGPFTVAGNVSSPDMLARWLIRKPEVAHRILRLVTDYYMELAQYTFDTFGVDGVLPCCGEATTANQIISPKQFEEFALPYQIECREKIFSLGYKTIYTHICGEQNLNLPYWVQCPMGYPGLISIGHEIELHTAAEYFPNDIIVGNLEPAFIQFKTPEEVYEATRKNIEEGMKIKGGYIFSPGCELPPMAPVENVTAMNQAILDHGWY